MAAWPIERLSLRIIKSTESIHIRSRGQGDRTGNTPNTKIKAMICGVVIGKKKKYIVQFKQACGPCISGETAIDGAAVIIVKKNY